MKNEPIKVIFTTLKNYVFKSTKKKNYFYTKKKYFQSALLVAFIFRYFFASIFQHHPVKIEVKVVLCVCGTGFFFRDPLILGTNYHLSSCTYSRQISRFVRSRPCVSFKLLSMLRKNIHKARIELGCSPLKVSLVPLIEASKQVFTMQPLTTCLKVSAIMMFYT